MRYGMKKYLYAVSFAGLCLAAPTAPSWAQAIDYGSLEMLFEEPVTTSATGKPQRKSDVPVGMEIITHDDIRRSGMTTIPDVLRRYAGIDVVRGSISQYDVGIRGYNQFYSPRLLVLINGRQVYMDHFAYTAWQALPISMADIRQIELVKGPNTALFGFNAVSGVINIITFDPLYDDRNQLMARVGTQDHFEASAVATLKYKDKAGTRISMTGFESNNFESSGLLPSEQAAGYRQGPEKRSANIDSVWQITDHTRIGVEVSHSILHQTEVYPTLTMGRADYEVNSVKGHIASDTDYGLIEITAYYNVLDVDYQNLATLGGDVYFDNDTTVIKIQDLIKPSPKHTIRGSAEYRHNESSTTPATGATVGYDVWSGSLMWDWQIREHLSWTNAARVDHLQLERSGPFDSTGFSALTNEDYDRDITDVSYNSGLVWKPNDKTTVNLAISRGIQVPSLVEFGAFQGGNPLFMTYLGGDPGLNPTVVRNYEAALIHKLPDFKIGESEMRTTAEIRAFHQTSDDVKVLTGLQTPTYANQFLSQNIGDSSTYGIELGLKGEAGEYGYWGANYTYQEVDDNLANKQGATYIQRIDFEDTNPQHIINLYGGYDGEKVELDGHAQYVAAHHFLRGTETAFPVPNGITSQGINGNFNLAARAGYKITDDLTIAISGQNLTQADTEESSSSEAERRAFLTLTWDFK